MKALTCLPVLGHRLQVRVHDNNVDNLRRGVVERVHCVRNGAGELVKPPRPLKWVLERRLRNVRAELRRLSVKIRRMTYEEFLRECPPHKRTVYKRAVESLRVKSVNKRDSFIRAFIKIEKLNWSLKNDPAPRVIHPRSPRYNVEVGRYLKPVEKIMYTMLRRLFKSRTVMKGMNADEVGQDLARKWRKFTQPVAVGLDASRFDQHVSVDALRWEHATYVSMFSRSEARGLRKLLKWQLHNKVTAVARDGTIKYETDGCRMSGDMNTSLGNCLLMCCMVRAYMASRKIPNYELVNNGDDCVVMVEKRDLARFSKGLNDWFLELGFNLKVEEPVYHLEQIEFCQGHPVLIGGSYRMVRNLHPGISRDMTTIVPIRNPKEVRNWLRAVGQGGLSLTGGVPIYQNMYRRMASLAGPGRATSAHEHMKSNTVKYWAERMSAGYSTIGAETRFSFWLAFGITPDMQLAVERLFDGWEINTEVVPVGSVNVIPTFTGSYYN